MAHKIYDIEKHFGRWYVIGLTGGDRGEYMPISDGYKTKAEARKRIKHYIGSERAMKREILQWDI